MAQAAQVAKRFPRWILLAALLAMIGITALALFATGTITFDGGAQQVSAQSAASAPTARQQTSAKQSIQIERPIATFEGRSAPSAAFPFTDEEYIAAGKCQLENQPKMWDVKSLAPVGVYENYRFGNPQDPQFIAIGYKAGNARGMLFLATAYFPPGGTLKRC